MLVAMEEVIRDKATRGTFKNKFKLGKKKPPEWKTQEVSSMENMFFLMFFLKWHLKNLFVHLSLYRYLLFEYLFENLFLIETFYTLVTQKNE